MHPAPSYPSTFDGSRTLPRPPLDLLQGTLDLLMLKTLSWGPAHGYSVARWIERLTGDMLQIGEGSLHPAPHPPGERGGGGRGWGGGVPENSRRAKFYRLTPKGRQQLRAETTTWLRFVDAMAKVLRTTEQPG